MRIAGLMLIIALAAPLLDGQTSDKFSVQRARAIMEELAAHQFAQVDQHASEQLRAALPAEKLAAVWASLEGQVGRFEEIRGVVVSHPADGITEVTLICHFERTDLDALLPFDSSGQLVGLRFRPSEGGASNWSAPAYAKPDSFTESAVTVTTGKWSLPGTLTLPKGEGPFPAVVLVHGSGPNDADETIGPNKVFKDLAWGLASRGIAVLRYEKRTRKYGMESSADPAKFTVNDETVDDARSAVAELAKNPAINPHRIFVVGHSLGAVMAPRIATGDSQIEGIVLMAGAITPIEKLALDQVRTISERTHVPAAESGPQIAAVEAEVRAIESPDLRQGQTVTFLGSKTPASYWLDLRSYHPGRVAAALHIPILILQGGRDYQVPPGEMGLWEKELAGHKNVTYKLYPALNHLFIAGTGPSTPANTLEPGHVDEPVIAKIATWVKEQGGRP